ncbi:MAG: L-serine ammonia-lyase, iron-sulfur-dependent, subunit alpha [Candidatus Izimaplasma sp.]|nr:L-serine ammonia-lyase, iron-sulfur-dependent, subunit alpha [Candidatus Izimaplasma bacterium]
MINEDYQDKIFSILKEELVPAKGCTEPVSIAYAAAKAREILGEIPNQVIVSASGNLIKNIRCVTVPNTGNLVGIEASVITGLVGGNSELGLEVIENISKADLQKINQLILKNIVKVNILDTNLNLHFKLTAKTKTNSVTIEIKNLHTNIVKITKNNQIIFEKDSLDDNFFGVETDRSFLTIEQIINFSETAPLEKLKSILKRQINDNMNIAKKGINGNFGVQIGKTILKYDKTIYGKMKAYTAAASEARMSGCSLPVITNSGSGNQGLATSIPVIIYSDYLNVKEELLYRALTLSNLLTIYQKGFIGRLSAFCGAISATVSSGATITYLEGGSKEHVKKTISNALANVSGVVCDGAKPSCASKIVTGLEASFLGHHIAMENKQYNPLSGILKDSADHTITAVGKMASEGMKDTDKVILALMLED